MSIRVRSRGPRRRGSMQTLVRTNPKGIRRFPPSPWIGAIARFCNPLVIADYESLATGSWTADTFYDCWRAAGSPVFGGDLWDCQYHVLSPPVSPAVGAETSVILPPIRLTVSEPAADGDPFTLWTNTPFATSYRSNFGTSHQIFAQNTWLPISGDSHVSAGKPTLLSAAFGLFTLPEALYDVLGLTTTIAMLSYLPPVNYMVAARYVRIRRNGAAVGSLIDRETVINNTNTIGGAFPHRLQNQGTTMTVGFPSNPGTSFPSQYNEAWEFDFTAGDTIEVDVWLEARIRNWNVTETRPLLIMVPEVNQTYSLRIGRNHTASPAWTVGSYALVEKDCQMRIDGLKVSYGFDPSIHTYQFTPSGGTITLGTARAPAMLFYVDSKRLQWRYDVSSPATAGVAYTTTIYGSKITRWDFSSVSVGAIVTVRFAAGGDTFSYTALTTDTIAFVAALKVALDAFIAAHSGDPYWSGVTTFIPPANQHILEITYDPAETLIVTGTTAGPGTSKYVDVSMDYSNEMVLLTVTDLSLNATAFYRPQSSGDYVEEVDDEFEGTLLSGPIGVFNHLGTTVFELWKGAQDSPYDGRGTLPAGVPSSITVTKTNQ